MRYMEDIKDMLCDELERISKKGDLTAGSLDAIDKLTHSIKSITTILAMEGYSGDDASYRRGRSMTTGRYISRASGRSYDGGYSRDGMKEKLEELMEEAPDDHTRQEL